MTGTKRTNLQFGTSRQSLFPTRKTIINPSTQCVSRFYPAGEKPLQCGKVSLLLVALACAAISPVFADDPNPGTVTNTANNTISHPGPPRNSTMTSIAINAAVPPIDVQADREVVRPESKSATIDGDAVLTAGNELTLSADHIDVDGQLLRLDAYGDIVMRELDTTFTASSLRLDGKAMTGTFYDATVYRYPYFANAHQIEIDRQHLRLEKATFTTTPPGYKHPIFSIRADSFDIDELRQTIGIHNAEFYLLGTRLITIPHIVQSLPKHDQSGTVSQSIRQTIGYNGYDGVYIVGSDALRIGQMPVNAGATVSQKGLREANVGATYTLLEPGPRPPQPPSPNPVVNALRTIRAAAQANEIPVPEHDPLRFHDYTSPSPIGGLFGQPQRGLLVTLTGNGSYNEQFFARRVNNLRVSQIPEVDVNASTPFGKLRPLFPPGISADGVREVLKQSEWMFDMSAQEGYYRERYDGNPLGITSSDRTGFQTSVESRPLLIGPNLLLRPKLTFNASGYTATTETYEYLRSSLAVMKLFTDLTGLGFEYDAAIQRGSSPFIWDTLDTPNELDIRAQYGNSKVIMGAVSQLDLDHHSVYTTTFSIGPNLQSVVPRLTYDTRSSNIGFGADFPGLSF